MLNAFVSYSYNAPLPGTVANEVRAVLESHGINVLDGTDLVAGISPADQIQHRILRCDLLVVVDTKSARSDYVSQEVGFAIGAKVPVILVTDELDGRGGMISHTFKIVRKPNNRLRFFTSLSRSIHRISSGGGMGFVPGEEDAEHQEILFDLKSLDMFSPAKRKRNYTYDITFGKHAASTSSSALSGFFCVKFRIRFDAVLSEPELYIECARTEDNFHSLYKRLVRQSGSIYRYIMKTSKDVPVNGENFNVTSLSVNGIDMVTAIDNHDIESGRYIRYVSVIGDDHRDDLVGKPVTIEIEISTIADRDRNEFTAIFGYPVKNLDTSFLAEDEQITDIDVVDVVSSRNPPVKTQLGNSKRSGAKVSVRGWMLPESAIIYVWNRSVAWSPAI